MTEIRPYDDSPAAGSVAIRLGTYARRAYQGDPPPDPPSKEAPGPHRKTAGKSNGSFKAHGGKA